MARGDFNSVVQYDNITDANLGQLWNDDHSAMRRTKSIMNNSRMALRPDEILRHRLVALRDVCDAFGPTVDSFNNVIGCQNYCQNRFDMNSLARLIRCSPQEQEPDFAWDIGSCHQLKKNLLV